MKLDARYNPSYKEYAVYDAKQCRNREDVVWVDNVKFVYGVRSEDGEIIPYKSSGIMVIDKTKLIIINIVPDDKTMSKELVRMLQCENK